VKIKIFVLTVIFLLSTTSSITSANAILGLGKCDKVKKEMLKREAVISKNINLLAKYAGTSFPISSSTGKLIDTTFWTEERNLKAAWKLGTNNPKCFTNTQNMVITDKAQWRANSYVVVTPLGGKWMVYQVNRFMSLYLS
jgi:hypothetical protein